MNNLEKIYFDKLSEDRAENAKALAKRSMRGVWKNVIEKYSDQAHFIYELLQNADDAGADSTRFILNRDGLIFAHNGTRLFSVSDPDSEDADTDAGKLGDINAITSIGNSNKGGQSEAKIGKFGVGFKAVFQYTETPHIYGPNIRFRIRNYIVPELLDNDHPLRRKGETLFYFPFDKADMPSDKAHTDIAQKLNSLKYPLLFLTKLKNLEFSYNGKQGCYRKESIKTKLFGTRRDTVANYLGLEMPNGGDKHLWLFTRRDANNRAYSCGFFVDEKGALCPVTESAFCFFPTKKDTGLKFIIHAPFLLTDSREGIRAGDDYNKNLIDLLADLAADSLEYLRDIGLESGTRLIDDGITALIPYNESNFSELDDPNQISFKPFYTSIQNAFKSRKILPTQNGYAQSQNAYWAGVPLLTKLFSNEQLGEIVGNPNAEWVFTTIGRESTQKSNSALAGYLDSVVNTYLSEDNILDGRTRFYDLSFMVYGISGEFIEHQPIEWLHRFYEWLSESKPRQRKVRTKAIFLDKDKKAAAAFDSNDQPILFLPDDTMPDCRTVYKPLLQNKVTAEFIKSMGIAKPSMKDYIYTIAVPKYKTGTGNNVDIDADFKLFFDYYCSCSDDEQPGLISIIRYCKFLRGMKTGVVQNEGFTASGLYMPTEELTAYFVPDEETLFVARSMYIEKYGVKRANDLDTFLYELGVHDDPQIEVRDIRSYEAIYTRALPDPYSTSNKCWHEPCIDGCSINVLFITENQSIEQSVILWNMLVRLISSEKEIFKGTCEYFYYHARKEFFDSLDATKLKTSAWLCNESGEFVTPGDITREEMYAQYVHDPNDYDAISLMDFLGIQDKKTVEEAQAEEVEINLTDEQREALDLGRQIMASGLSREDLEEFLNYKKQQADREAARAAIPVQSSIAEFHEADLSHIYDSASDDNDLSWDDESTYDDDDEEDDEDSIFGVDESDEVTDTVEESDSTVRPPKVRSKVSRVIRDIAKRASAETAPKPEEIPNAASETDEDEYTRPSIDYGKRIERAKQKSASEINRIEYLDELQEKAKTSNRYSYGWFNALFEMEALSNSDNALTSREVSISFARVEREEGTRRTLVLKQPNRYIPQFMEDLADIPLMLYYGDETRNVAIEVANIKSYTLRVKLKANANIDGIDLSKVTEARIDAKSPAFLLEELRKQFAELGFDDEYDMRANLCENIDFIFGPPGTGKTTYLARNVLIDLMRRQENAKVLVLTPTNKAADVLTERIIESMGDDTSYVDWLIRFGATQDEKIEQSPVFRDKTYDIRKAERCITITTIARFPYDFFMPSDAHVYLRGINWDYIVVDEASMIPLGNIIYPLYKKTPKKFIIAGDPFQIEPITSVDLWKGENIYTMVNLDSFVEHKTVPHDYKVTLLTTQYRSTPVLGTVFSKFAYGGILKHDRTQQSRRNLNIDAVLPLKSLNLIKFPVSKYESIYRAKRLQRSSSYQVYSALFTYEFVLFLTSKIADANPGAEFRLGVIAPYRAQADLIDKLLSAQHMPAGIDVQVGTIHGFQGDECDIIIAVFNTPPTISASNEIFLNKRNIINVSISRARDYLFVLMPDDNTQNIENLRLVRKVEALMKESDDYAEFNSAELERVMFGSTNYLEDNAFSTGHQSVNVYGLPEKRYEVRSEENAVDIQIHRVAAQAIQPMSKPTPSVEKAIAAATPTVSENKLTYTDCVMLERKTQTCPYDGMALMPWSAVPVMKKNGQLKKINMNMCPQCKKLFIVRSAMPDSINTDDYCLNITVYPSASDAKTVLTTTAPTVAVKNDRRNEPVSAPRKAKPVAAPIAADKQDVATKRVRSKSLHRDGSVVREYINDKLRDRILIKFDGMAEPKEYDKRIAFDKGELTWLK